MSENDTKQTTQNMSSSKAKRERIKHELEQQKKTRLRNRIIGIGVAAVVAVAVIGTVASAIIKKANQTTPSSDYAALLNEDGTIKDLDIAKYVKPIDPASIVIDASKLEYTDEQIQTAIDNQIRSHREKIEDSSVTIKDGDTVNIDYVGTVDGVEFEGGSTNGNGTDLEIGSGSYVDDFEQQLIGHVPGDEVSVEVTFPEDYSSEDLQGKDAVFAVTVNAVYQEREFDDAFVQEFLSDYGSTVEEYKQYLRDTNYDSALGSELQTYISENAAMNSVPKKYVKALKSLQMYEDDQNFQYMAQLYSMYGMANPYTTVYDYVGAAEGDAYEAHLQEAAEQTAALNMTYQDLFTKNGLTISDEDYAAEIEGIDEEYLASVGKGFVMQYIMREKVIDYLKTVVKVEDLPDEEPAAEETAAEEPAAEEAAAEDPAAEEAVAEEPAAEEAAAEEAPAEEAAEETAEGEGAGE